MTSPTARNICRHCTQQGERQEPHHLLALVYGWFTEGFATADLQEAGAVLEELAAP